MESKSLYLGGKDVSTGDLLNVRNPFNGKVIRSVHRAGETEIESSLALAGEGFKHLSGLACYERSAILSKISRSLQENRESFARLIAEEAGKPINTARAEVDRSVFTFKLGAEEAGRIEGELLPMDRVPWARHYHGIVRRFPIGILVAITPFNFPLNLVAHKLSPAFACGNSVILKPSSLTPLTALKLADVCYEAGLPPEALSVLPMDSRLASLLISDPRPAMVTFTGSPAVGWPIKGLAGKKRVTLELGGNAGVIVHEDASIPEAVSRCVTGGYSYAGQSCISVQRIYVHDPIYDDFRDQFLDKVSRLWVGDPLHERTDVGPLITESEAERVESWIDDSLGEGTNLLCGGQRKGAIIQPAVLEDVPPDKKICREEVFGPVTLLFRYQTFEEAVAAVNDSDFGLQAGLFTHDVRRIHYAFENLEVGGVVVNNSSAYRVDHQPYGGVKDSGFGREGIRYAVEEMTERKILIYTNSEPPQ